MLCTPNGRLFVQSFWLRLQTSRAWLTKKNCAGFWQQQDRDQSRCFSGQWYASGCLGKLPAVQRVARALKDHLQARPTEFHEEPLFVVSQRESDVWRVSHHGPEDRRTIRFVSGTNALVD